MKPGIPRWATNALHAAGADPWSGQPNKVAPSAGKIATGRVPEERPPAEETNMWRWMMATILTACSSARAVNYSDGDTTGIPTAGIAVGSLLQHVEYDPATGFWGFVTDGAGANVCEEIYSRGGIVWQNDAPIGWGGVNLLAAGYGINPVTGLRSASFQAADQLFYTLAGYPGLWAQWNGVGATGNTYSVHDTDAAGSLWVVYNATGATLDRQVSPIAGGPPVACATQPGFAGAVITLKHSRHAALEVDQYDAGNPLWLAITATEVSTSVDGDNWLGAVPHGIPTPGYTVEYSAHSRRWHAVNVGAGALRHYYSDDDGANWNAGTVIDATLGVVQARLASDRFGALVCVAIDAVTAEARVYATVDDGVTWREVAMPASIAGNGGDTPLAGFGGGRFMVVLDDGGAPAAYLPYYGLATIDQ